MGRRTKRAAEPPGLDEALLEASGKKDPHRVRLLLEAGADVAYEPRYLDRPLRAALQRRSGEEVVGALIDAGASLWRLGASGDHSARLLGALADAGAPHLTTRLDAAAGRGPRTPCARSWSAGSSPPPRSSSPSGVGTRPRPACSSRPAPIPTARRR